MHNKLIYKLKAFFYAILAWIHFTVIGQLGINEIMAVADSFSLTQWRKLYRDIPDIKKINIAYFSMFIFQAVSDFVNHSAGHNYIRGWAAIIMAILTLNFLTKVLYKSFDSILYYLIGGAIGVLFFNQLGATSFGDIDTSNMGVFKFYVVPILNNLILFVAAIFIGKKRRADNLITALLIFYGLFCMMFDARSNGMFFILTGLLFLFKEQFINYSRQKAVALLIVFLVSFQGLYVVYINEVVAGKIGGEHTKEQLQRVNYSYNPLYLLFSGRTEFFVAIKAIQDEPVFGHGSWAPDPTLKYTVMILELQGSEESIAGILKSNFMKDRVIPAHSVLIGAWLEGGVGAFLAIIFIFILYFKRCFYLLSNREFVYSKYFPIVIFFMLSGFWIFLFSPLPHIKDTLPIMIAFVMVTYQKLQDKKI